MDKLEKYPLISIIVPVYNNQVQILDCLESIQKQTYTKLEVLIIDDGSFDNSISICSKFCERDKRFKTFTIAHKGVANARNYGIKQAHGTYIAFVDADDTIDKYMYEDLCSWMWNHKIDLAICSNKIIKNGKIIKIVSSNYCGHVVIDKNLIFREIGCSVWNKLYKKSIIIENCLTFPLINVGEDANFVLKYILVSKSAYFVKHPHYNYVNNPYSVMHDIDINRAIIDYACNLDSLKNIVKIHKDDYVNLLPHYHESIVNIVYALLNILVMNNIKKKDALKYEKKILDFFVMFNLPISFSSKFLHKKIMLYFSRHKMLNILYTYMKAIMKFKKIFRI